MKRVILFAALLSTSVFGQAKAASTPDQVQTSQEIAKLYQSALKALKTRDSSTAKRAFQKLVAKGPKAFPNLYTYYDVYVQLIQLEVDEGFCSDARAHLEDLMKCQLPDEVLQLTAFIEAHLLSKEASAEKALEKLADLKEKLPFAQWPQREKLFHHSVSYQQDSAMDALMVKADEAFQNKDLPKAWGYFKELIRSVDHNLYPKAATRPEITSHIYFYGGKTLSLLGHYNQASTYLSKVLSNIQNASELPQIRYELAYAYMRQKAYVSALEVLKAATSELDTANPFCFRSLALYAGCALKAGRGQEAKKALELIKENANVLKGNAKLWHQSGQLMLDYVRTYQKDDAIDLKRLIEAAIAIFSKLEQERPSDLYKLKRIELKLALSEVSQSLSMQKAAWENAKNGLFSSPQAEAKAFSLFLENGCPEMANLAEEHLCDRKFLGTAGYQKAHLRKGLRLLEKGKELLKANPPRARIVLTQAERHISVSRSLAIDKAEKDTIERHLQKCLSLLYSL